jgi:hypothetical protein
MLLQLIYMFNIPILVAHLRFQLTRQVKWVAVWIKPNQRHH